MNLTEKKTLMKRNNIKNRFGGAILIIIILIIVIGAGVGIYYGLKYKSGKELQEKQTKLWEESFTLFNQKQPEAAYLKLTKFVLHSTMTLFFIEVLQVVARI